MDQETVPTELENLVVVRDITTDEYYVVKRTENIKKEIDLRSELANQGQSIHPLWQKPAPERFSLISRSPQCV